MKKRIRLTELIMVITLNRSQQKTIFAPLAWVPMAQMKKGLVGNQSESVARPLQRLCRVIVTIFSIV